MIRIELTIAGHRNIKKKASLISCREIAYFCIAFLDPYPE